MPSTRILGSLVLDDGVNSFLTSIIPPLARVVQTEQYPNRAGRLSQVRRDWAAMNKLPILGTWKDGGGKYWRDFLAALYYTRQAPLSFGDGTCYYCVDVVEVTPKRLGGGGPGSATPSETWAYVANCISYEPFRREVSPSLSAAVTLTTGNGTFNTSFNATCAGTAHSEPTWQFSLTIPNGVTVTQIQLQNTTTGDIVTAPGLTLTNNSFTMLIDASGGVGNASGTVAPPTPGNNLYGLLAMNSNGYGVSGDVTGSPAVDFDFTGTVPTLQPSGTPTVPPSSTVNTMVASITANGALTSASLKWLAPSRWVR